MKSLGRAELADSFDSFSSPKRREKLLPGRLWVLYSVLSLTIQDYFLFELQILDANIYWISHYFVHFIEIILKY